MKALSLLFLLTASALASARQPRSILNQIPYLLDPDSQEVKIPLLDTGHMLSDLDPLPDFQIPSRLPPEFQHSREQKVLQKKFQHALQLLQKGEAEAAAEIFRHTLELHPGKPHLHVALADSLYATNAYEEAREHYEFVLKKNPFHFQSLNNLAWLLSSGNDPAPLNLERARVLAVRAKLIRQDSHHVWSTLSQIYFHIGRYADSEEAIQNALRIAQQHRVSLSVLVKYMIQRDRAAVARNATSILE